MRLTFPMTLVLLLPACGDNGGESSTSQTSSNSNSNSSTDAPSTGTTNPTTGGPASSSGEPVSTSDTSGPTGSGTTSTTDASSSSGPGTSEPGSTTDASSSGGTDTGVMPGGSCKTDKDCALHNDCCDCFGIPAGEPDPICKKLCDQPICDGLGIDQAVCRFGVCGTERIDCDGSKILCDSLPPDCPKGQVPGVQGGCWSGMCVPALSCNVVPDCGACPPDSMCVQKIGKPPTLPTCEPIPDDCGGKIDCECAGTFVCTGQFNACNFDGGNQISCGCPQC